MLVVDTSAILNPLARKTFDLKLADRSRTAEEPHAPHHIDVAALNLPLVTSDGRLARAGGHRATVELFQPSD